MRSVKILEPLVGDKEDPVWVAWVKHIEYYKVMLQDEVSFDDIAELDSLIFEAQEAFDKASELAPVPALVPTPVPAPVPACTRLYPRLYPHLHPAVPTPVPAPAPVPVPVPALVPEHALYNHAQYGALSRQVPELKGFFKPKHHMIQHAPLDTFNLGPMRGFWTYAFEGFHQVMKRAAEGSNFKNVSYRIVDFWRMDFAMRLGGV